MAHEATAPEVTKPAPEPTATSSEVAPAPVDSATSTLKPQAKTKKPPKAAKPALAPSPMPAPPTPALSQVARAPSEPSSEADGQAERTAAKQRHLITRAKPALHRKFPDLCKHDWLGKQVGQTFNASNVATAQGFANATMGKVRFPKWADNVDGPAQPSLADMLAYYAAHEVLPHAPFDKFRCVTAEQHITEKIEVILARRDLTPEIADSIRWSTLPFNVVNGTVNVTLPSPSQAPPQVPLQPPSESEAIKILKREAANDQAYLKGIPPAKRSRTAEEDAQTLLHVFEEEVKNAIYNGLEDLSNKMNEDDAKKESEVVKVVQNAMDHMADDIPSKLDSSLGIFGCNLKQEIAAQVRVSVKAAVEDALRDRDGSFEESMVTRLAKLEDTLKDEIRNAPSSEAQPQGYPVYCMPSMPLQMPQIPGMGHMAQQMIQNPQLGGFVSGATPSPRNGKSSRDGQSQGFRRQI